MKRATLAALAGALVFAGCGGEDVETPVACLGGPDAYLTALEAVPGDVRLAGTTPIGDCLVSAQAAGDLGRVAESVVAAANRLNREARREPAGDAAVQLGYLIGAVQQAAETTGGIHRDLVLRLDSAARFNEGAPLPASFERAFGTGYAAGIAEG